MEREKDGKRFRNCLLACAEVYGKPVGAVVTDLWWMALKLYDVVAVESAFQRHITSPDVGQYMPKPADIVRMLQGTALDASMRAWALVDKGVRSVGPYPSVTFDDPIIQRVILDMGGWAMLNGRRDDEWPFIANEFRTRYQGYRSRGEAVEYPAMLTGICATENAGMLRADADAVLIGNPIAAQQVRDKGAAQVRIGVQRLSLPDFAP